MVTKNQIKSFPFFQLRQKAEEESSELPALQAYAEKAATSILTGDHEQRKPGSGEKFWQFREYDPSDRPQDIDWRMSARTDKLYVRQKEWQTTQTALFWVQHDKPMLFNSNRNLLNKFESAMILALGMSLLLTQGHEKIGHMSGSFTPGRTSTTLQKLAEELFYKKTQHIPIVDIEKLPKHANFIMIGDFLSPIEQIKNAFIDLSSRSTNGMVFQVLDPAELTLPYEGRFVFEDIVPKNKYHIQNVSSIRIPYQERINSHLEDVRQLCKKHSWHWLLHRTDTPIRETLFDAWTISDHSHSPGGHSI